MDQPEECPVEEVLLDFVAHRLDAPVRRRVEEHLVGCARCSAAVEWMKQKLLTATHDELGEQPRDTEGLCAREGACGETKGWDSLDDYGFDMRQLAPSENEEAMGRLGAYDVLGVVGCGGMGIVFKAYDERLRRVVAIKALNRRLASNDIARRRFIREARAAAGINHPNVVTIHAVEEHNHYPLLVLEYVGGGSLREYLREKNRLEPLEVVRLSKEIASGLAAAHAHGVIHRDIKPGNILLEEGAVRVKITDFGLARAAVDNVELTSAGLAVGTPSYMSPEQVRGEKVDLRTDLFSLGCVMYAMIAGHSPFRGQHALEIARKVTDFDPPPLEKVVEGTPVPLSDLVAKLLAKNPDERCQSATEVAEVLGRYMAVLNEATTDELFAALHGQRAIGRTRHVQRQWLPAACAAVLVTVTVMLGVLFFWLQRRNPAPSWHQGAAAGGRRAESASRIHPELITVASTADADVHTLGEALLRAGPETVIRILDGATYAESVEISDAARLRGITLEAAPSGDPAQRPTLVGASKGVPVIRITGVPGVVIRGLRIEPADAMAIYVFGHAAGTRIEDVEIECRQGDQEIGANAMDIRASVESPEDPPVVVSRCSIHNPPVGLCVFVSGARGGGASVRLEGNCFRGKDVQVLLSSEPGRPLGQVIVERNLFLGCADGEETKGINLNLQDLGPTPDIRIANNTFLDVTYWLGLVFSDTSRSGVTVCNNLILGSIGIEESHVATVEKALENWRFEANWWETGAHGGFDAERWGRIAVLKPQIALEQREDPTLPSFLQPSPGSPLFTAGCGRDGLLDYVGAKGPSEGQQEGGPNPSSQSIRESAHQ